MGDKMLKISTIKKTTRVRVVMTKGKTLQESNNKKRHNVIGYDAKRYIAFDDATGLADPSYTYIRVLYLFVLIFDLFIVGKFHRI